MLKRLTVAVAALFMLSAQAFGAGTIPGFSLTPQFDLTGKVAPNCFLYVIQAGTVSTPQNAYQDSGLTLLAPNPLRCDASARLPQWFVADGSIKVRLTKSDGAQIFVGDNLLVVGASSGGGGGGSPVDPTTIIATGDVKVRYGTGVLSGFVRMNGRTIGSASSGATERANADAQALFEFLWGADANLVVSSGRGGSANADWTANKTLALPDMRGRSFMALADMGNTATGILTGVSCTTPTALGTQCGTETKTITQAQLPSYTLPIGTLASGLGISNTLGISDTLVINDPGHQHVVAYSGRIDLLNGGAQAAAVAINTGQPISGNSNSAIANVTRSGGISITGGIALTGGLTGGVSSGGSGSAFSPLSPIMLITTYIKL